MRIVDELWADKYLKIWKSIHTDKLYSEYVICEQYSLLFIDECLINILKTWQEDPETAGKNMPIHRK